MNPDLIEVCLDAAMRHYPKGCTYTVQHGQSWDHAAATARRKELRPLVEAVVAIVAAETVRAMTPPMQIHSGYGSANVAGGGPSA